MTKLYSLCQRYYQVSQTANNWLEDAQILLQFAQNGLDTENSEENLRNHTEFFNTEKQFRLHLKEVKMLVSDMEPFIQNLRKEDLEQKVRALEDKSMEIEQEEPCQKELLQRYLFINSISALCFSMRTEVTPTTFTDIYKHTPAYTHTHTHTDSTL